MEVWAGYPYPRPKLPFLTAGYLCGDGVPAGAGEQVARFPAGCAGTLDDGMPGVAFVVNGSLVRGGGHFVALCREGAARHGWDCDVLVTEKAEAGVSAANAAARDG